MRDNLSCLSPVARTAERGAGPDNFQIELYRSAAVPQDRIKTGFDSQRLHQAPAMNLSTRIKPIRCLKASAVEIVRTMTEERGALVIAPNDEAKALVQDVAIGAQTQETMALLKILALGQREIEKGAVVPAAEAQRRRRVYRHRYTN